jgi:hypothetical protein
MLVNVVEGAEAAGACLAHVYCMEGGKWYGQHLRTELKTPHREDDPPVMPPMFYFDLQAGAGSLSGVERLLLTSVVFALCQGVHPTS